MRAKYIGKNVLAEWLGLLINPDINYGKYDEIFDPAL